MARFCVKCSIGGDICDFCRFASHNQDPTVDQAEVHDTDCTKHGGKRGLFDGCDDFECFEGEKWGWRE